LRPCEPDTTIRFDNGGGSLIFNRFTGPGRVGIQSAYYHPPGEDTGAGGGGQSNQTQQMPGGGLLNN
jgi:uncharacterized protein (AIM24 family)